jgi:hypothetical protein
MAQISVEIIRLTGSLLLGNLHLFINLANGHLAKDIDALMPWAYAPTAITSQ